MNNILNIIREAQKILYCPVCKRRYSLSEIKLKGFLGNIYILQTKCGVNHSPATMTIIIHNLGDEMPNKITSQQIQAQDIKKLTKALENFDGDFKNLWKISN